MIPLTEIWQTGRGEGRENQELYVRHAKFEMSVGHLRGRVI